MWSGYGFGSSATSSPSSYPIPAPPPPSPNDSLLDINPRKCSFSMTSGNITSCAFPSWPNRSSLYSDSDSSTSAYLSDEDLFPTTPLSDLNEPGSSPDAIIGAPDLTTEEQIHRMNEVEQNDIGRLHHLAQAHAQARALQALRAAQVAAVEQAQASRRRKRRVSDKKRRVVVPCSTVSAGSSASSSTCTSVSESSLSATSSRSKPHRTKPA
ncbi:hypothetical protein FQN57_000220 [Myotisia sp. PD_48]|nr:hypothetical protein FQN57_000220 [Myotisia sp. PD_48]